MVRKWFLVVALLVAFSLTDIARADEGKWVLEFDVSYPLRYTELVSPVCQEAIVVEPPDFMDRRKGGTYSCGSSNMIFNLFFGRACFNDRPWMPRLQFECGYRHRSNVSRKGELWYDSVGLKTRFTFGRSR